MWIRSTVTNRLVNLANASYLEVAQFPPNSSNPWCMVAVFIMEYGNQLTLFDTHVLLRQTDSPGAIYRDLLLDELAEIERQLMAGNKVYEPAIEITTAPNSSGL